MNLVLRKVKMRRNDNIDVEEVTPKKLRKRILFGTFAILASFAMILGIMFTIASADKKVRNLVMLIFGIVFACSLVAFYIYVLIDYKIKKKKLMEAEKRSKVVDRKIRDDWK